MSGKASSIARFSGQPAAGSKKRWAARSTARCAGGGFSTGGFAARLRFRPARAGAGDLAGASDFDSAGGAGQRPLTADHFSLVAPKSGPARPAQAASLPHYGGTECRNSIGERSWPWRRMAPPHGTRGEIWWTTGGSNPRPLHCERSALPAELVAHADRFDNYNIP